MGLWNKVFGDEKAQKQAQAADAAAKAAADAKAAMPIAIEQTPDEVEQIRRRMRDIFAPKQGRAAAALLGGGGGALGGGGSDQSYQRTTLG